MRKKRIHFRYTAWGLYFWIVPFTIAQNANVNLQTLLQPPGAVIDIRENAKYHIFGDIAGFVSARIHQAGKKFQLHLLRNIDGRAQILILDVSSDQYSEMQNSIMRRVQAGQEAAELEQAVYPVEESKWAERSRNKKLVLRDGSQLLVTLTRAREDTLVVQTLGGLTLSLPDTTIEDVMDLSGEMIGGKWQRTDPNTSRLFFSPTGRRLVAGDGYFADYFVFFPTVAYGLTDFLSISGGMSLIPGLKSQLFYFAPKLTFQISSGVGLGTGVLYLNIPDEENDLSLGYAVMTGGSERSGVTVGFGRPFGKGSGQNFILLIGGEKQISNRIKLITENWLFTGNDGPTIFSGGIRFFGEKMAVDFALLTSQDAFGGNGFPFVPWLDFSIFFGK